MKGKKSIVARRVARSAMFHTTVDFFPFIYQGEFMRGKRGGTYFQPISYLDFFGGFGHFSLITQNSSEKKIHRLEKVSKNFEKFSYMYKV